ncbi:MAG: DUF3592 domain-containing protein [Acidobacteriaceae bacterium]|nr:DUF3592 domain-containing protein [Acidobacteriaceae bacterium]
MFGFFAFLRRTAWVEAETQVASVRLDRESVLIDYSCHATQRINLRIKPRYKFGHREADVAQAAQKYFNLFPVGLTVTVRYNPKRPSEAVLVSSNPVSQVQNCAAEAGQKIA